MARIANSTDEIILRIGDYWQMDKFAEEKNKKIDIENSWKYDIIKMK